ncbi:MAG: hypothetical protein ABEK02_03115 [Haloquadratum sp.]
MRSVFVLLVAFGVVVSAALAGSAVAATGDAPPDASTPSIADAGALQVQENETATPTNGSDSTNGSDGSPLAPGAKLAAVVAVQGTAIQSEVGARAFGQRVAAAATNRSKAAVVATELNDSRERLETLRTRLSELRRAYEAGNVSEARYRVRMAQLNAEINALQRQLALVNETSASLPAPALRAHGVNASEIDRLRTRARNLSGPEVAAIARGIAGPNAGRGLGDPGDAPGRSGVAPGRDGNRSGTEGAPGHRGGQPGERPGAAARGNATASGGERSPGGAGPAATVTGNGDFGTGAQENASSAGGGASGATGQQADPSGTTGRQGSPSGPHSPAGGGADAGTSTPGGTDAGTSTGSTATERASGPGGGQHRSGGAGNAPRSGTAGERRAGSSASPSFGVLADEVPRIQF